MYTEVRRFELRCDNCNKLLEVDGQTNWRYRFDAQSAALIECWRDDGDDMYCPNCENVEEE